MKPQISKFENLPDDARVSAETFSVLLDVHLNTVWRRAKNDPTFPKPIRLGNRCTRFLVRDVRAFLNGVAA